MQQSKIKKATNIALLVGSIVAIAFFIILIVILATFNYQESFESFENVMDLAVQATRCEIETPQIRWVGNCNEQEQILLFINGGNQTSDSSTA